MKKALALADGIKSLVSSVINRRDAVTQNYITSAPLDHGTLREIYRNGIASKIVRLKSGRALKDTIKFDSTDDELFYNARLAKHVKNATRWMLAFGRGIIVVHKRGDDLNMPLTAIDPKHVILSTFSGDMVTTGVINMDLQSPGYYTPITYNVRGSTIHYSRVVAFNYVEPPELDKPQFFYGGMSEYQLIYDQLIADGVVQRASPKIIEKASTIFYKVKGFKDAVRMHQESDMVNYFSQLEDLRGIHSAGLIDADDEVEAVQQNIANLSDADQITLRRLAMVTGISLSELVGESVKGLNATGDNERASTQETIETLQSDYLLEPINRLMSICGKGAIGFKENQGETPNDRIDYETKVIDNAVKLQALGADYTTYLHDKDVLQKDDYSKMFETDDGAA